VQLFALCSREPRIGGDADDVSKQRAENNGGPRFSSLPLGNGLLPNPEHPSQISLGVLAQERAE